MLVLLSKLTCSETLLRTVEKTVGTVICAGGRVRPHELFGLIAENQVSFSQRRVPAEVPGLADLEVAQKVRRYVRSERNGHQRIEKLFGVFEVRIDSGQIEKSELGKLPKEREVGFEMVHE